MQCFCGVCDTDSLNVCQSFQLKQNINCDTDSDNFQTKQNHVTSYFKISLSLN